MLKLLFLRLNLRRELTGGMVKFVHLGRNPYSGIDYGRKMAVLKLVFCLSYESMLSHGIGMQ